MIIFSKINQFFKVIFGCLIGEHEYSNPNIPDALMNTIESKSLIPDNIIRYASCVNCGKSCPMQLTRQRKNGRTIMKWEHVF